MSFPLLVMQHFFIPAAFEAFDLGTDSPER